MREQFEQLEPKENAPDELKEEVLNSLSNLRLVSDVINLYTAHFVVSGVELTRMIGNGILNTNDTENNQKEKKT